MLTRPARERDLLGKSLKTLAHPTRFERVTFAFGGQTSPLPIAG
jgi:hypothetical protein